MSIRASIATTALNFARSLGRTLGCELVVETSQHSLATSMQVPGETDSKAWDPDLYKSGQIFYAGYANPIKPTVTRHTELEDPDQVDVLEGDAEQAEQTISEDDDERHAELISSARYRKYMRQDLISQLLTPRERWRLIAFAIIGLGALQFIAIAVTLWATGSF